MSETFKTSRPMSPLRARMIEDMNVRSFVPATQREYLRAVKKLADFLRRSPDTATVDDLRGFQVHLAETGAKPAVINATVAAPKSKAMLGAAYGAGLRAMEVVSLVANIDSQPKVIRVEQGKGHRDRFAMLSPQLLELLRDWYKIARPQIYLFPGCDQIVPMTRRGSSTALSMRRRGAPVCTRGSRRTHCGIGSQRTCWN